MTAIPATGAISGAGSEQARAFLKVLADRLDVAVTTGETTGLTMVASPPGLGMIRSHPAITVVGHITDVATIVITPTRQLQGG